MNLTAITKVLAQYKKTEEGIITDTMISEAWAELLEAESRLKEPGDGRESERTHT